MPKYTFEELLEKMNETQDKLAKIVQNSETIPSDQLKKEGVEYKEILSTKPDDLYTETG